MRAERGFSLIELLIALMILTLVITMSLAGFLERNRRLQQASETILAYQALANEAEYWRRINYGLLEKQKTDEFLSDTSILLPLEPYTTEAKVTDVSSGVKSVVLTIRWRERVAQLPLVRVNTGGRSLW